MIETPPNPSQNVAAAFAIMLLCVAPLLVLAIYTLSDVRSDQAVYARLDREGVGTSGEITGWYRKGSRSRLHYLEFRFQVGGRSYDHVSPVSTEYYYSIHRGSRIGVIYLPSNPDSCRLVMSIGPEIARNRLWGAAALVVAAFGFPAMAGLAIRRAKRRSLSRVVSG